MMDQPTELVCRGVRLSLAHPCVMGILNVTPDSFADTSRFVRGGAIDVGAAVAAARAMIEAGAAIIDIGGESTRPGATGVSEADELNRVIPVVERLGGIGTMISVDTSKPAVAKAALAAGAHLINDVRAMTDPEMLAAVAEAGAGACLMHMRGEPRTMQEAPHYADVVAEVRDFLEQAVQRCLAAGISPCQIVVDPGFGFGKTLAHNLRLLRQLDDIVALGYPVLVGLSRKRMIGVLTGQEQPAARVHGSVAAALVAVQRGARIVRAHDVAATVEALKIVSAVMES